VYRAHNDFTVTFILLLFDEYIYLKFPVWGGGESGHEIYWRRWCRHMEFITRLSARRSPAVKLIFRPYSV